MATIAAAMEGGRGVQEVERSRILHLSQYNVTLQHTILEADRIDARGILERAASEVVYQHLVGLPEWFRLDPADRLRQAADLFRHSGLGVLRLDLIGAEGGEATVTDSTLAGGWTQKYGKADHPVCTVASGYLAGALAAVYDRSYRVVEESCSAQRGGVCVLRAEPTPDPVDLLDTGHHPVRTPVAAPTLSTSRVPESEIVAALFGEPLVAAPSGQIQAFGESIIRVWADYYNKVSYRFEREVPRVMGNKFTNLASIVLTEAGHVCAFHTFGGILVSDEWHTRVRPLLESRIDWVHALVAVINAMGWGTWRVHALVPGERLQVRVYGAYEAEGYLRHFGRSDSPRCYLSRGAAGAIMNLLFVGDITTRPPLTPSYYNELFRSPLSFRAMESRCASMHDPYCELLVNPLSPSLNSRFGGW